MLSSASFPEHSPFLNTHMYVFVCVIFKRSFVGTGIFQKCAQNSTGTAHLTCAFLIHYHKIYKVISCGWSKSRIQKELRMIYSPRNI